jgi:hypothetical protein
MNIRFSLQIDGIPVDLFNDETIQLNRQLKDLQDLSTVWTDYTQSFQIPASDTNNQIFADWFDENVVLGAWNPNLGKDATLLIHSLPVYEGRVEFIGCKYKDGIPQLYNIVFYGTNKKILDQWGEKLLNQVDWSSYNHFVDYSNILSSWNQTLLSGDVLWPIADYNQNWRYSKATGINGNIRNPRGVEIDDLRPAIRLRAMMETVFEAAGYTLQSSFLQSPEFDDLYILPMQTAGPLYDPEYFKPGTLTSQRNGFTYTQRTYGAVNYDKIIYNNVTLNPSGNYNATTGIYTANRLGNYDFRAEFGVTFGAGAYNSINFAYMLNGRVVSTKAYTTTVTNTSFTFSPRLKPGDEISFGYLTFSSVSTGGGVLLYCLDAPQGIADTTVRFEDAMPQMKIKDFVNGVIKTFNCILYPTGEKTIALENLPQWYNGGTLRNWSPFADTKDIEHDKLPIPSIVSMTHKESECIANEYYRNINRREYGSISFAPEIDYPTDAFQLESPFNVICPSVLYEVNANGQKIRDTELNIPRFMDKDDKPVQQDLTLFYYGGKQSISDPYYFNNVNQYVMPLMTSYSAYPTIQTSYSVAFGLEFSARGDAPTNTMYLMYWHEYLSRMYSTQSRLVKMTAIIPVGEWLNFELNDTIAISGNYYKVQSVKYDMLTEVANLELITYPNVDILGFSTTGQKPDYTDVVVNANGKSYLNDYPVAKGIMNSYRFGTQDYLDTNQDTTFNQNSVSDIAQQMESLQAIVQFNQITMFRTTPTSVATDSTLWAPVPQELQVSIGYTQNITSDLALAKYVCTDGGQYKFTGMCAFGQTGNKQIEFEIQVNGVQTTAYALTDSNHHSINFDTILDLSTTDEVTFVWKPHTGGSRTIIIEKSNFLVLKK